MIRVWKPVPNYTKGRSGQRPEIICLHIGDGTKEQIYSEFLNAEKSSHYCVNKDGSVWQFVLDENTAWTNGDIKEPTSEIVKAKGKLNPNCYSLTIEHEGYGHIDINSLQYETTAKLVKELSQKWNIPIDEKHIIPHRAINSVTKTCPGKISIPRIIVEAIRPPVSLTPAQKASILSVLIAFLADNAIIESIKNIFGVSRTFGAARSKEWRSVRVEHLRKNPACAVCGGTKTLEVHHIKLFSQFPAEELNPQNLITLCESGKLGVTCHRFFGHLGNYRQPNPDVVMDSKVWNEKLKLRP